MYKEENIPFDIKRESLNKCNEFAKLPGYETIEKFNDHLI